MNPGGSTGAGGGVVAAVDLGATSGRVVLGHVDRHGVRLQHVARFANEPVTLPEGRGDGEGAVESAGGAGRVGLHWDVLGLWRSATAGLAQAVRDEPGVASIGVDSWAVDYGLLRDGRLLGAPHHYRDERSAAGVEAVHAVVPPAELFARTGLQHLPFNTVFQLAADRAAGVLAPANRALLVPDLFSWWLTGVAATERTNASTTGLLSPATGEWDVELMSRLGLTPELFAPLVDPGASLGPLLPSVAAAIGAPASLGVTTVGSHDTASAVVAVPLTGDDAAYVSSGTWSLVGLELPSPLLGEDVRAAGFTNEGGVDGRVRFLKNVSGLWLLSESMRAWSRSGTSAAERSSDLASLLAEAAAVTRPVAVFDATDERFTPPGDMPARIEAWCVEHDVEPPRGRAETVRSILESLAAAYAATLRDAERLSGRAVRTVHVVGGGSQNELLCQLTADRTGCTVLAGPVEATALGNVLVQARAAGFVRGSLESLRALVRHSSSPVRYEPRTTAAPTSQRG
ncbi:rhamnulokinase [Frigoribacterium sp. VKM Ac-1396]|uniref:rhamnulokinase n=1 Tax=Frigoribacterium sp. VKM Ac-1396 TaxID=2783821 RepID=UPI00188CF57F|nr:rhamnulokinase family protein [Frigoribacterium sp. VKM Ac-1396]MBF4602200.1 rhamnulokinase [Frigoribacterium sp. VKM Ac-1396]